MKLLARITCKNCGHKLGCPVGPERVNQMFKGECPKCHQKFEFRISSELIQKLESFQAQHIQAPPQSSGLETYVPGMEKGPMSSPMSTQKVSQKDETYVPIKNDSQTHHFNVLVLKNKTADLTPIQRIVINQAYSIVGRKNQSGLVNQPDIEINTQDKFMSKKHCLIKKLDNGQFSLEDYNSANGTKLNGKKIEPGEAVYLMTGDKITLGHTDFYVSLEKQ